MTNMLTIERLREALRYDADSGIFTWKVSRGRVASGDRAGNIHRSLREPNYYRVKIHLDGKDYLAHRLAWFYTHGRWPSNQIDHINGDPTDNRIVNLREATHAVNRQNLRNPSRNNIARVLGAHSRGDGLFCSQISVNGKRVHLGTFTTASEAHEAYMAAKRKFHPGCST